MSRSRSLSHRRPSGRRRFVRSALSLAAGLGLAPQYARAAATSSRAGARPSASRASRIGVSTYSFWQFNGPPESVPVETCIDRAAQLGFDGVEILHIQMSSEAPDYLQSLKRRALVNGLDLYGFSTHQGFLSPLPVRRQENIAKTIHQIEVAYQLGIPTMRVNTGRWQTTDSFDELMANRGIEPPIPGYTDEDGFVWVIDALERCLPRAQECGVVLGLENHWGLGRTPEGVLRIVEEINSPWLKVTLDTGNFLEEPYDKLAMLADHTVLLQAKTYFGGGKWYTLDLDYRRIAAIMRDSGYNGYVSLEFEGMESPDSGVPASLELLRGAFQ
jgi:sugar phosphate isomerase/epimerase